MTVREWIENEVYDIMDRYNLQIGKSEEDEIFNFLVSESVDCWDGTDDPDDEENGFIKDRVTEWVQERIDNYAEELEEREA